MAFLLKDVVPWGRNLDEYQRMFNLTREELKGKLADFGGGPSSFQAEAARQGIRVTSYDILYQFDASAIRKRITEVRDIVMEQMRLNQKNYVWNQIRSLEELEKLRMNAMEQFLQDYETGKEEGRYIFHALPDKLEVRDNTFDIGLSSHFLLMYEKLGFEFHRKSIEEMFRVCKEIRIYPICDLDGNTTRLTTEIMEYFSKHYIVKKIPSSYQFQKCKSEMLVIK